MQAVLFITHGSSELLSNGMKCLLIGHKIAAMDNKVISTVYVQPQYVGFVVYLLSLSAPHLVFFSATTQWFIHLYHTVQFRLYHALV